tara:strand:- start:4729 stop:13347 length:8619 start_codon:yes stop_codon:yes gene_type:complete
MPDIKHNFARGKMNKDADERLVPNGEYTDAMNIQVSTSEGSNVGTVQNILGNAMPLPGYQMAVIGNDSVCVGAVSDEKNDAFYYFVKSGGTSIDYTSFTSASPQGANGASKDVIFQYKNEVLTPVFVATSAFAYTIYGNGISWDTTTGTITFGPQHDVSDLSIGMQLIASGYSAGAPSFPISATDMVIVAIDTATNSITILGNLDWLDNTNTPQEFHGTKLFFTTSGSASNNTILNFVSSTNITAINIIDDMLFWTDATYDSEGNLIGSEPKKINIPRSIAGTVDAFTHTNFINEKTGVTVPAQEKHITVIKENPKAPPSMLLESTKPSGKATMGETTISFEDTANNPGELLSAGDQLIGVSINHGVWNNIVPLNTQNNLDIQVGDIMVLELYPDNELDIKFPLRDPIVQVRVTDTYVSTTVPGTPFTFETLVDFEIVFISPSTPLIDTRFLIDLKLSNTERILKFKFPKFAVRYKYQDNEYSAYSPFTQAAFIPMTWDYQPKKGLNEGMQNHLKTVTLSNIVPTNIPDGVVQVDILYKESGSSNIYLVDQIKPNDGTAHWLGDQYVIDSELIYTVVAENQILRPYDNVPKIARAQEVTGSRLVYGNYKQNYNILAENSNVRFDVSLASHNITQDGVVLGEMITGTTGVMESPHYWNPKLTTPLKSIKSLREYQIGVVFEDKYGRQSPVMTSSESTIKVSKEESGNTNLLDIKILNDAPPWADSFRFFIKEPSTEYYNLAMDRWYDAEDGNVWLTFPSLDRNKITEESTIILKKNINSNIPIEDTSEYKVIAISNEVPDFVKSTKVSYGLEDQAALTLMGTTAPQVGSSSITVDPVALTNAGGTPSSLIHAFEDWRDAEMAAKRLWIRFHKLTTPKQYSNWYEVVTMDEYEDNTGAIATDPLLVRIHTQFQDDIEFIDNGSGAFCNGAALEMARSVDTPYAAFDGRFFVKILKDLALEQTILTYDFTQAYNVVGMLQPRFLRYTGLHHMEAQMSSYNISSSWDIGSGANAGQYQVFGNTPESGGWLIPSSVDNPALLDYNGYNIGTNTDYRASESFQNPRWTNSNETWAYSANVMTLSHGKDTNGVDKPVNIYPKSYPYMLGAYNDSMGASGGAISCFPDSPAATSNTIFNQVYTKMLSRNGLFWKNQGQNDNWFIDMEPTWYFPEKNWNNGVEEYYAKADLSSVSPAGYNNYNGQSNDPDITGQSERGYRNTPGVGARLGSRRMDISYVGPDYLPISASQPGLDFQVPNNQLIHDFLTGPNPVIEFVGDPGQIKYTVVDYRVVEQIQNTPDDEYCDASPTLNAATFNWPYPSTSRGLYRVRYELLLDQPIGTTVQDQGIITPTEYVLAGGTPDEHHNQKGAGLTGDGCCNGTPVYAREYKFYPPSYEAVGDRIGDDLTNTSTPSDYATLTGCYSAITSLPTVQADVNSGCATKNGAFYDQVDPAYQASNGNFYHNTSNPITIDPNIWTNADGTTRLGYIPTQHTNYLATNSTHDVALANEIPMSGTGITQRWAATEDQEIGILLRSIFGTVSIGQEEDEAAYNPAIWETLPIDPVDLELYYEASRSYPMQIKNENYQQIVPIGGTASCYNCAVATLDSATISNYIVIQNTIYLSDPHNNDILAGDIIKLTHIDGSYITVEVAEDTTNTLRIKINNEIYNSNFGLDWYNCFAFGNGVESDRISDTFNSDVMGKGVKVSTILEEDYEEEHRKYGLIYSGLYNSTSGVNNLNQFIAAEKITKDVNPIYGNIEKLHSRNTDLITLCEDKVLKILANKDAVFNADGNIQLTATGNVLGQTVPFVGQYGISKNPESFASESYRAYFTDKTRGTVMRLSMDGLTPISNHGMKDWFRDNLQNATFLKGSFDDRKTEYNITLNNSADGTPKTVTFREDVKGWVSFKSFIPEEGLSCANNYYTFNNGYMWRHHSEQDGYGDVVPRNQFYGTPTPSSLSFYLNDFPGSVKSFTTINYEGSKSRVVTNLQDNEYYNLEDKDGWYVEKITTDKEAGSVDEFVEKEGKWFNYIKGDGITVNNCGIITNQDFDESSLAMQGFGVLMESPTPVVVSGCTDPAASNYDPNALVDDGSCIPVLNGCLELSASNYNSLATNDNGSCLWQGCTDITAFNPTTFPPIASTYGGGTGIVDDGSCIPVVYGCMNCGSYWESLNAPLLCGSSGVPSAFLGAFNYDPAANTDTTPTSCINVQYGCMEASAMNTWTGSPPANVDPGYCKWLGCTNPASSYYGLGTAHGPTPPYPWPPEALTYVPYNNSGAYGMIDDGSCIDVGCPDSGGTGTGATGSYDASGNAIAATYPGWPATNYSATAVINDGSCVWATGCGVSWANNYDPNVPVGSPNWNDNCNIPGCQNSLALNFNCATSINAGSLVPCSDGVTVSDGSCVFATSGCTEPAACNYDSSVTIDDGSCEYTSCAGCMDPLADNYMVGCTNLPVAPFNPTCTIECDYSNPGTDCCIYNVYGCMDATACNAYQIPATTPPGTWNYIDDGTCSYTGCTDPTALNYVACATVNDGSCTYAALPGCMDDGNLLTANGDPYDSPIPGTAACNYQPTANSDNGTCVYGFQSLTMGDPNAVDVNGNPVTLPQPVYYHGSPNPSTQDTAKHYLPLMPANANPYPVHNVNQLDIGLSIKALLADLNTQFTGQATDSVEIAVLKADANGIFNIPVYVKSYPMNTPNFYFDTNVTGSILGDRIPPNPYAPEPFGPHHSSVTNVEFDVFKPGSTTTTPSDAQEYRVDVWFVKDIYDPSGNNLGPGPYGFPGGAYPDCGISQVFTFTPEHISQHPAAIPGCTDPTACNYDCASGNINFPCSDGVNVDDGSCFFGTAPLYYYNPGSSCCTQGPGCDDGNSGTSYTTHPACCNANPQCCN